jgi:hypothetical protein
MHVCLNGGHEYSSLYNSVKTLWFRCFFFLLHFTKHFGLTGHHLVYKVCFRSLLCFPFDIFDSFRCFIQVILRHAFVSNNVFGLCLLNMLLSFSLVLYLLCLVLRVSRLFGSVYLTHGVHRAYLILSKDVYATEHAGKLNNIQRCALCLLLFFC